MLLISQLLTVGILATIAMTAFSYGFSYFFKSNFKEPQLLNILIDRLQITKSSIYREHVMGWVIHFSVGLSFVVVFKILEIFFDVHLTLLTGLIFGIIAGLIGAAVWSMIFLLHPNPPSLNRKLFYMQLIFAHIIFGVVMIVSMKRF